MKLEFSLQIFEKSSNMKFHENPSSGSRVVPCGWTEKQTETDRYDEAKAPKKHSWSQTLQHVIPALPIF